MSEIAVIPAGQLTLFDLATIANREHALAFEAGVSMIEHAIRAGEALIEAKAQLRHGEWLPWVADNFDASEDTAERYMNVARNSARVRNLEEPSLRRALGAIADDGFVDMGGLKSSVSVEWYTPADYISAAREVLGGIDLDPASSELANQTVAAAQYFNEDDNGLERDWHGRVWLNPPYGKGTGLFATKLVEEYAASRVMAAVLLINAYGFDSGWFQPLWDHPLCFTDHRITFTSPQRGTGGPANANLFIYLGPAEQRFAEVFSGFGAIVRRIA